MICLKTVSLLLALLLPSALPLHGDEELISTPEGHLQEKCRCDHPKIDLRTFLDLTVIGGSASQSIIVTPFATAPDGKVYLGKPTSIAVASALNIALEPVKIRHPLKGSYTVGGFISLDPQSIPLPPTTIGISGTIRGQIGSTTQAALIPSSIMGAPLLNPPNSFLCTYSTQFEVTGHVEGIVY